MSLAAQRCPFAFSVGVVVALATGGAGAEPLSEVVGAARVAAVLAPIERLAENKRSQNISFVPQTNCPKTLPEWELWRRRFTQIVPSVGWPGSPRIERALPWIQDCRATIADPSTRAVVDRCLAPVQQWMQWEQSIRNRFVQKRMLGTDVSDADYMKMADRNIQPPDDLLKNSDLWKLFAAEGVSPGFLRALDAVNDARKEKGQVPFEYPRQGIFTKVDVGGPPASRFPIFLKGPPDLWMLASTGKERMELSAIAIHPQSEGNPSHAYYLDYGGGPARFSEMTSPRSHHFVVPSGKPVNFSNCTTCHLSGPLAFSTAINRDRAPETKTLLEQWNRAFVAYGRTVAPSMSLAPPPAELAERWDKALSREPSDAELADCTAGPAGNLLPADAQEIVAEALGSCATCHDGTQRTRIRPPFIDPEMAGAHPISTGEMPPRKALTGPERAALAECFQRRVVGQGSVPGQDLSPGLEWKGGALYEALSGAPCFREAPPPPRLPANPGKPAQPPVHKK